jgi:uncharacterized protein with von Willebrand factor type A (vWA) domain
MGEKAIQAVMDRARESLGPIQKSYHYEFYTEEQLSALPHDLAPHAIQTAELDVEETFTRGSLLDLEPVYQVRREKDHGLVLILDTSLSMKGEKLALLGVTVAAVAMSLPSPSFAILGFDSEIHAIKKFQEESNAETCIQQVLSIPPGGFTNIQLALETAQQWIQDSEYKNARMILVSDGRYTEGKNPIEVAKRFPFLYTVKIGKDPTGREVMRELADTGIGRFSEVREMKALPSMLLQAIRMWVR